MTTTTPISINFTDSALATILGNNNISTQLTNISKINNNSSLQINTRKKHRQLPPVQVCHGCCVKLTSKDNGGK